MRFVLDTNVVVSALLWGGKPFELLEAAALGDVQLYTSDALMAELRAVLARPHLAERLLAHRSSVDQAIILYAQLALVIVPSLVPRVVPDDQDDDQVVAAALSASADLIVTGDRDLLRLGAHQAIAIVTPAEAVNRLGGGLK
jgi:putative PIN family toxin of toxin-antitoxin system